MIGGASGDAEEKASHVARFCLLPGVAVSEDLRCRLLVL